MSSRPVFSNPPRTRESHDSRGDELQRFVPVRSLLRALKGVVRLTYRKPKSGPRRSHRGQRNDRAGLRLDGLKEVPDRSLRGFLRLAKISVTECSMCNGFPVRLLNTKEQKPRTGPNVR